MHTSLSKVITLQRFQQDERICCSSLSAAHRTVCMSVSSSKGGAYLDVVDGNLADLARVLVKHSLISCAHVGLLGVQRVEAGKQLAGAGEGEVLAQLLDPAV